jgi:hypothetical protein
MSWDTPTASRDFVFSNKWPTSNRDTYKGIMVKRIKISNGSWESPGTHFCPLKDITLELHASFHTRRAAQKGEKKKYAARIYLFEGSKE